MQPFRNTATGGLVNGGHAYVTKAPSKFDGLFNISYGSGIWPDYFASEGQNFTGIWVQLADWEQSAFALEATDANPPYISIFLIDGYAQNPTLVWLASEGQYSKSGKFPLCPADEDAGIAVLQLFTDASHTSSALNGMVAIVIGDHSIFGATKGCFPEATPQTLANYLQAIKNSNPQYFADLQDIRAIDRNVLYVGKSELGDDDN